MAKSIKKNIIYNTFYNLLTIAIPFITTPYISRVLGPEGIGIYSYSYSIAYYFVLFTMLGLNKYGNRAIAAIQGQQEKISKVFCEIYTMQFVMGMISTSIYLFFVLSNTAINHVAFVIQIFYVVSAIFDVSWFFFGLEQFGHTVLRSLIIRVLNVVALFVLVHTKEDIYVYCAIMAVSTFLSQICLWPILLKKYVRLVKPSFNGVLQHIKPNLILFVPTLSVSLYKIMDKIMLGTIIDTVEVGYYENAEKIINIPMTLITAVGTVMLPRMTYLVANGQSEQEQKYIKITLNITSWISCAMACGIIGIADVFIPFFLGNEFGHSIVLVYILAPTLVLISWGTLICNQIMIPHHKEKNYIIIVIIGAITNLVLNMLLIPRYLSAGAAMATLVTEVVVACGYTFVCREFFEWKKYIANFLLFCVSGVLMVCIVYYIPPVFHYDIANLLVKIILGVIVYSVGSLLGMLVLNREMLNEVIRIVLEKKKLK